jgi:DNA-binding XRE family transcriptional regulator
MRESNAALTLHVRSVLGLNQQTLAKMLGLSRRTIQRWDSNRSDPYALHLGRMAVAVHPKDPVLAARIAERAGTTLEGLGIAPPPARVEVPAKAIPDAPPALSPAMKGHLVDAVVCAAADAISAPPATVRPVLLAALRKAAEVDLTVADLVQVLAPPPPPTKSKRR